MMTKVPPTVCVIGGWEEPTHETENCQGSDKAPKNAQSPRRPVHALLGAIFEAIQDKASFDNSQNLQV